MISPKRPNVCFTRRGQSLDYYLKARRLPPVGCKQLLGGVTIAPPLRWQYLRMCVTARVNGFLQVTFYVFFVPYLPRYLYFQALANLLAKGM